jgi:hypothetical protein
MGPPSNLPVHRSSEYSAAEYQPGCRPSLADFVFATRALCVIALRDGLRLRRRLVFGRRLAGGLCWWSVIDSVSI